jgi:xanthine/uracil/vitamin C permease (AzgA family)
MTTIVLGSITSGFGMVMITFVVIKAVQMEWKEIHPIIVVLAIAFIPYFILLM